jgi:hypothetical protein
MGREFPRDASLTNQKGWRRAEVVEPRKRLLGRQAPGAGPRNGEGVITDYM